MIRNGKRTKIPFQPNGKPASSTDRKTWSSFDDVVKAVADPANGFDGIGFVFSGEVGENGLTIGGIDFDHLEDRKDGEADDAGMLARQERATRYLPRFKAVGAYIERSPSGAGVHVIGWMMPLSAGVKRNDVEAYTAGRFFTFTGSCRGGGGDEGADCTEIAQALVIEIAPERAFPSNAAAAAPSHVASPAVGRSGAISPKDLPEDVRRIIHDFTTNTFDGGQIDRDKRARLLAGDLSDYKGPSEADLAVCSHLARRGASADQIDTVMRSSGLYRAKWEEKRGSGTYGSRTIAKAMEGVATVAATAAVSLPGALHQGPGHALALHGSSALTPITPGVRVPVWSSWTTMPPIMDGVTALAQANSRICFVRNHGGAPAYLMAQPDGRFTVLKSTEVTNILAGFYVQFVTPDGPKKVPLATWWMNHPNRATYDRTCYDPASRYGFPGEAILNTWQGFGVQPAKGSWRRIRWHLLHVICGGDKRLFKYLMRWLAHCVQHPGSPGEVMVVLKSDFEGAGKSTLGKIMVRIFGRHGFEAASLDRVFGDFNDQFATLSFVLLEEAAFPGDHKRTNAVKATITGGDLTINPKGRPAYTTPNTLHFMLCTNEAWAVQARKDARRFFVLDVTMKKDRGYFDALFAEIDAGGTAAFLDALLHVNLAKFNPRDVPVTQALVDQQRRSAGGLYHWIFDSVVKGALIPDTADGGFGQTFPAGVLHDHYRSWALGQGERRPMAHITFGKELSKLGFTPRHSNGTKWTVPDAKALFTAAEKHAGIHQVGK